MESFSLDESYDDRKHFENAFKHVLIQYLNFRDPRESICPLTISPILEDGRMRYQFMIANDEEVMGLAGCAPLAGTWDYFAQIRKLAGIEKLGKGRFEVVQKDVKHTLEATLRLNTEYESTEAILDLVEI